MRRFFVWLEWDLEYSGIAKIINNNYTIYSLVRRSVLLSPVLLSLLSRNVDYLSILQNISDFPGAAPGVGGGLLIVSNITDIKVLRVNNSTQLIKRG